jgi:hypothetical protein
MQWQMSLWIIHHPLREEVMVVVVTPRVPQSMAAWGSSLHLAWVLGLKDFTMPGKKITNQPHKREPGLENIPGLLFPSNAKRAVAKILQQPFSIL